ncbi:MAG: DUF4258 domain-containing protein [Ruminococcus sp.]|nr:DUF4258 domain-containing protein [Ruminococcus sp.]
MIDIKELRAIAADAEKIVFTQHVLERIRQREVEKHDLLDIIMNGEIIEPYPNDRPFPSCLILYLKVNGKPLHLVCSMGNNKVYIITVYEPDLKHWEPDFMTRREKSK